MQLRPSSWLYPFMIGCFFFALAGQTLHAGALATQARSEHRLKEAGWKKRHAGISAQAKRGVTDVMFLGDSITQGWGDHRAWRRHFGDLRTVNAGISSDRVEHMLWRVRNGNMDGATPKVVVLLGGVNNLAMSSPRQIAAGHRAIIEEIRSRSPDTRILLLGVFPSGSEPTHKRRSRVRSLNSELKQLADGQSVVYLDIGKRFLDAHGRIPKSIMHDGLHLTIKGYDIWGEAMQPTLRKMLAQ